MYFTLPSLLANPTILSYWAIKSFPDLLTQNNTFWLSTQQTSTTNVSSVILCIIHLEVKSYLKSMRHGFTMKCWIAISAEDIPNSISQETNSAVEQTNKKNPFLIISSCEDTDSHRNYTAFNLGIGHYSECKCVHRSALWEECGDWGDKTTQKKKITY